MDPPLAYLPWMENKPSAFSVRLKELREKAGLSLRDLAEQVEVSHQAIKYYEDGVRKPGFEVVCRLAKVFGVSIEDFH